MYQEYYGLKEKPFRIVPNPAYLFMSTKHRHALTYLEYGLSERAGFVLLTGDIGTGKTTLIRYLLDKFCRDMDTAFLFNTNVDSTQILDLILAEFNLKTAGGNKAEALERLYEFLIRRDASGKPVVLIIDEAHNLPGDALEEIRMLSNLHTDENILLQIVIVGQPELRIKLASPAMMQFAQRIAVSYHLSPLTAEETGAYIAHRLKTAGGRPELFTAGAVDTVYQHSGGIPRTINLLCDAAMVYGFADEARVIDAHIVNQVIEDKGGMGIITETAAGEGVRPPETNGGAGRMVDQITALESTMQRLRERLADIARTVSAADQTLKDERIAALKAELARERDISERLRQVIRNRARPPVV